MSAQRLVYSTELEAAAAAAVDILEKLKARVSNGQAATLAVSGGKSPKLMFQDMAKTPFDWSHVHLFWVDERPVGPTDPQSNYRLAKENLIDPARIPPENVHRIQAELGPGQAAHLYADEIRRFFGLKNGELPHFDVVHRGVGPDAHTASLFPGEPLIDDRQNLVAAIDVQKMNQRRITLLPGVLEAALHTVLLVTGADKAEPVRAIFHQPYDPKMYPAQIAANTSNASWFLDQAAARLMD